MASRQYSHEQAVAKLRQIDPPSLQRRGHHGCHRLPLAQGVWQPER